MDKLKHVSIRPGVTILSVLKHLNYKPYYALAEFVDNSIDSYLKYQSEIVKIAGSGFRLSINIEFNTNDNKIIITDNAAGIHSDDYQRAFRTAEVPPDNTKLSEFGMGMKSAACWFTDEWEVRTTALDEDIERTVIFDISKIVHDKIEELEISTKKTSLKTHYTVITLKNVDDKMPIKSGLGKVKRHLASIYRDFIRRGVLELKINGEPLKYISPKILKVPYYETPDEAPIEWLQKVEFDFGSDGKGGELKARGFVAIMETMSIRDSGFALFRRGRVIEGSADNDEGFRPAKISGSVGSHRYKRLFGELHLEGFKVSHTKDGFQWDDNMDAFLDILKEQLENEQSIPILKQADKFRIRESVKNYQKVSKKVVDNTADIIKQGLSEDVTFVRNKEKQDFVDDVELDNSNQSYYKAFTLNLNDTDWQVHIEVSYDETIRDLIQIGDHLIPEDKIANSKGYRTIGVRLSLLHPFMIEFAGDDSDIIEPILRIAVALGLSEVIAKETKSHVSEVRNNLNELLKGSLSKP